MRTSVPASSPARGAALGAVLAVLILFVPTLMAFPAPVSDRRHPDSGLLLGLRLPAEAVASASPKASPRASSSQTTSKSPAQKIPPPDRYRTLWIRPRAGVLVSTEIPRVLVRPRGDRLFDVGTRRVIRRNWHEDVIFVTPHGTLPTALPLSADAATTEGTRLQSLRFVGSDYCCVSGETWGYREPAIHPWDTFFLEMRPLDSPDQAVSIVRLQGEAGRQALRRAARDWRARHRWESDGLLETPSDTAWGIVHRGGAWLLRGFLGYRAPMYRPNHAEFDVNQPVGRALGGPASVVPSLQTIRAQVPDALDAFASPRGDVLIVLKADSVSAFTFPVAGGLRAPAGIWKLAPKEEPVLAAWASGAKRIRWAETLRAR